MSKPRKSPTANENWIKTDTVDEYKKSANITLEKCKHYEREHKFKYVQISSTPRTFKRVLIN